MSRARIEVVLVLVSVSFLSIAMALPAFVQSLAEEEFVTHLLGNWSGTGEYDGNALSLERSWSLELMDQFLKANMRVSMPNGATFGALMYWRRVGDRRYEAIWMDGIGRAQTISALREPETGVVATTYLDEFTETGAEWRRWEFEPTGENSYVERMYAERDGSWEPIAEFAFERSNP